MGVLEVGAAEKRERRARDPERQLTALAHGPIAAQRSGDVDLDPVVIGGR